MVRFIAAVEKQQYAEKLRARERALLLVYLSVDLHLSLPSVLIWMLTILRGLWALVLVTVCILIYMCVCIYIEILVLICNLLSHVVSVYSRNLSVNVQQLMFERNASTCTYICNYTECDMGEVCNYTWNNSLKRLKRKQ